jgi:hypothetical protein
VVAAPRQTHSCCYFKKKPHRIAASPHILQLRIKPGPAAAAAASQICGYYCVHPYNPDWTAQHQEACKQAFAEAGGEEQQQQQDQEDAAADDEAGDAAAADDEAAAADDTAAADAADETAAAAAEPAAADATAADGDTDDKKGAVAAIADEVADKLAETSISS